MTFPQDNLLRLNMQPIELRAAGEGSEGNTLFGHFAVFNQWIEINSFYEGRFLERMAPGSFKQTIKDRAGQIRVLYDHGHDPSIGNKPLGAPQVLREDEFGAYYEVDLFDAGYVNDLKPALRAGQMGASFRFRVTGESNVEPTKSTQWNPEKLPERTITGVELYEFGPVTFPAYASASAGVRSTTDEFLERLLGDPKFVARFIERVGPGHAARLLTIAAGAAPASASNAISDPSVAVRGLLVASARTSLASLRKRH